MSIFPKISKFLFDQAAELYSEGRFIIFVEGVYVMASKESHEAGISEEVIMENFRRIKECNYNDWNEFVETNNSIYIIKRSPLNHDFFICSCPVGCKKHPCKHSVLIMENVEHIIQNLYAQSTPIQPKRKPGRPKLAKYALKID